MSHLNPAVRGECEFCGEEETVENLFLNCKRLEELFKVLMEWFRSFGETFFQKVFFYRGMDPVKMLKGLIAYRFKFEFSFYVLVGDLIPFREKWCVGEMLCCIYEEQLVINF